MHRISPIQFRLGKTIPWAHNLVFKTINSNSCLINDISWGFSSGIQYLLSDFLKNFKFFLVKNVSRYFNNIKLIRMNILVLPIIREETKNLSFRTTFSLIYKWLFTVNLIKFNSVYKRAKKETKKIFTSYRIRKAKNTFSPFHKLNINWWLFLRMFRSTKNKYVIKKYKSSVNLWKLTKVFFKKKISFIKLSKKTLWNKKWIRTLSGIYIYKKLFPCVNYPWNSYRSGDYYIQKDKTKIGKKYFINSIQKYSINTKQFSDQISAFLKKNIKIKIMNVFTYFIKKGFMNFKSSQTHFWENKIRKFRFQFVNYWDIMNSFFLISQFSNTYHVLLIILSALVSIYNGKVKKIFYFIDTVIKNLLIVRKKFKCFKLTLTGKIGGGTQRTKQFTVGFGRLVINSLSENIINSFVATENIAGAFGIKLVMVKIYSQVVAYRQQYKNDKINLKIGYPSFIETIKLNVLFMLLIDEFEEVKLMKGKKNG